MRSISRGSNKKAATKPWQYNHKKSTSDHNDALNKFKVIWDPKYRKNTIDITTTDDKNINEIATAFESTLSNSNKKQGHQGDIISPKRYAASALDDYRKIVTTAAEHTTKMSDYL